MKSHSLSLEEYFSRFNRLERQRMKIRIPELLQLLQQGEVQLIDVRFSEEYTAWRVGFARNISLNELPDRLHELDREKLVVTACPHCDRTIMGRLSLVNRGFRALYLADGLLNLLNYLRGDYAREVIKSLRQNKSEL